MVKISQKIREKILEIDKFNERWGDADLISLDQLGQLKKISIIESVGASNRIEGNKMSDIEVETLIDDLENQTTWTLKNRDEEEVAGYFELINTVYDNYSFIPISVNYIKQLHGILLKNVSKDVRHRGEYKKLSNTVAAFDENGKEIAIVFKTATPFDTPRLMDELVDWVNRALEEKTLHPLVVIGVFIIRFLDIHPFQDGNGRMSRALTAMLLLKYGYSYVPYISMESIIEANKEDYYASLRASQSTIWTDNANYVPWLEYFVETLCKQKTYLEEKIRKIQSA